MAATTKRLVVALLGIGLVARFTAALFSAGIIHPDEHQQYIEQSFRLVHGYGATFWEQEFGMRHPLFIFALAGVLRVGEAVGVTNPHVLAALQRLAMCSVSYGAFCFLAYSLYRNGRYVGAVALALLLATNVDLLFINIRVMSENACIAPLAIALALWPARPPQVQSFSTDPGDTVDHRSHIVASWTFVLIGLLLGTMVTLRLQSAPIAIGLAAVAVWRACCGNTPGEQVPQAVWLIVGLVTALLIAGWIDLVYYGDWFHSFFANLRKHLIDSLPIFSRPSPWYSYVVKGSLMLLRVSVFALPLVILGAKRDAALAGVLLWFVVVHSILPHKEVRFLWPAAPIVCLLIVDAVEELFQRGWLRVPAVSLILVASFLLPSIIRSFLFRWNTEPYVTSCRALALIGREADLRGVILVDLPKYLAGNYFFLRRNVPIRDITTGELTQLENDPDWNAGELNYVIAEPARLSQSLMSRLEVVQTFGNWRVFRFRNGRQPSL